MIQNIYDNLNFDPSFETLSQCRNFDLRLLRVTYKFKISRSRAFLKKPLYANTVLTVDTVFKAQYGPKKIFKTRSYEH